MRIVTVGETLLRLSPVEVSTIEEANKFYVHIAGAESNVAVGLSRMGIETGWISRLVNNSIGRLIANKIRQHGVDVSRVIWVDKGRNGLYYLEFGAEPRPTEIVYDRANSAFTSINASEIDWEYLLNSDLIHLTGITPALSENCEKLIHEIIRRAIERGCKISFDINYRSKLWKPFIAKEKLSEIIRNVDILICSEYDARLVFGFTELSTRKIAEEFYNVYNNKVVVITMGENGALAYDGMTIYKQKSFETDIIDRIGRGDSFAAGFLYGYMTGNINDGLKYGNAMASLKQTLKGDFFWCTKDRVDEVVLGKFKKLER